ncbi:MAG: hypothetical protein SPI12_06390 [Actinomycetaceae bacterium]|nr:hypothetical protein [Actinomycetaceae bacterium]MDY6083466.1 hypothetical protein [Actinomycetaceae bacterium]
MLIDTTSHHRLVQGAYSDLVTIVHVFGTAVAASRVPAMAAMQAAFFA